jgi:hypothetical protein
MSVPSQFGEGLNADVGNRVSSQSKIAMLTLREAGGTYSNGALREVGVWLSCEVKDRDGVIVKSLLGVLISLLKLDCLFILFNGDGNSSAGPLFPRCIS